MNTNRRRERRASSRRGILTALAGSFLTAAAAEAKSPPDHNLILLTADGLRWQEVFRGIDPVLAAHPGAGMKDATAVRERFSGTPAESRARLMPFFWSELVRRGVLFGNRGRGSRVRVRNRHRFSYPGYSEILTGRPRDEAVDSNDNRPNPSRTVLEILREEFRLPREKVAVFGSWEVFASIAAHAPGSVFINAGYRELEFGAASGRLRSLSAEQFMLLTPWHSVRHDYTTFEMALEYLRTVKPAVLYIALGETDDWAHEKRYDRYLEMTHYFDRCVAVVWEAVESLPDYQGRTTVLVTTDHGRGSTPADWHGHGAEVDGAEDIWMAAIGPRTTAAGEVAGNPSLTQSDIAPTMLELMGVDWLKLEGVEGRPVAAIAGENSRAAR